MSRTRSEAQYIPGEPAHLACAKRGDVSFYVQFGGQAGKYLGELSDLIKTQPVITPLIKRAAERLRQESTYPDAISCGFVNRGIEIMKWLDDTASAPGDDYLISSVISQPLIFLTQVANLEVASRNGYPREELIKYCKATFGHSQGVMTALLFALDLSREAFIEKVSDFAAYFFWQGIRMQEAFPIYRLSPQSLALAVAQDAGDPTPMAAIVGLRRDALEKFIAEVNKRLKRDEQIYISLKNTHDRFILSARPESLLMFRGYLQQKKIDVNWEYIATSAPFHSPYMQPAMVAFKKDLKRLKISFDARDLKIPLFATDTGKNLQESDDLEKDLLAMQYIHGVDWPRVLKNVVDAGHATHLIDLGPGDVSAKLAAINFRGRGIKVVAISTQEGKRAFFSADPDDVVFGNSWEVYRPRLAKGARGDVQINNAYTQFSKAAPIFGGAMVPATVDVDVVCAAANNGYIVELAGGGQVTEEIFRNRLDQAKKKLKGDAGLVLNSLYLDTYLWNLHYPLITKLKAEGYPLIGMTITAGIPETEKAAQIIRDLNAAGLWLNSFKAGTVSQVNEILKIADLLPEHKMLIQLEGGEGGGHHSWEMLDNILLKKYSDIRARKNLILCIGGGIATPEDAWKYLNGNWHGIEEMSCMPVDAVYVGTRILTCKEVKFPRAVKEALVELKGFDGLVQKQEIKGGITSGVSQLGADIYWMENSAAAAARLIEGLHGKPEEIEKNRSKIIDMINQTSKPYFGELELMTYVEVLKRMCHLMSSDDIPTHIPSDGVWYDKTFRERIFEFAKRIESRFISVSKDGALLAEPFVVSSTQLDSPARFLGDISHKYPEAVKTQLHPEDVDYFMILCRKPGKPVNFVPAIDNNIRKWFLADTLWQATDARYPVDGIFVPPGPKAVKGLVKIDEPVAEVFRAFEEHFMKEARKYCRPEVIKEETDSGQETEKYKKLYAKLWGAAKSATQSVHVTRDMIATYGAATIDRSIATTQGVDGKLIAPINMLFPLAWETITAALFSVVKDANFLDLVHLSNRFDWAGLGLIAEGDQLKISSEPAGLQKIERGTKIVINTVVKKGEVEIARLSNRFFIKAYLPKKEIVLKAEDVLPTIPLATSYTIYSGKITAPYDNLPYANASNDHNPIHLDAGAAKCAGFKDVIVHGMWMSAAAAADLIARGVGRDVSRLKRWEVFFDSVVQTNEELSITARHTANYDGCRIIDVVVKNTTGLMVMHAQAHVKEPTAAYVFTGQGSQGKGMGMDGYDRSQASKKVWDDADLYCRNELGFSILNVVRDNPVEMRVNGEMVRHPKGVLNLTQFTQVGITVLAMANIAELKEAGLYQDDAMFAGHSLGEYAALSSSGIIPLKEVVRTVYNRGLTMQHFVPRDSNGVSAYRMAVVRPNMVGLSEAELVAIVAKISTEQKGALEVVNYNIEGEQYSVTGEARLLNILEEGLKRREKALGATRASMTFLEGIDVPFHSAVLKPGVEAFRKTLEATIPKDLDAAVLIQRYIPNLNAKVFELTREYVKDVVTLTSSPVLKKILNQNKGKVLPPRVARTLLIELLAYQFASPVRWIETQKILFSRVDRIVEIGPTPVLSGMAARMLKKSPAGIETPEVFHVSANRKEVFCENSDPEIEENPMSSVDSAAEVSPSINTQIISQATSVASSAQPLPDEPLSVKDAILSIIALKVKIRTDEITPDATIEKLAGGNSARRNEIVADVGAEFNVGGIDDAHSKTIEELANVIASKAKYKAPGAFLRGSTDAALKEFFPINRKAVMEYLSAERMLGEGRLFAVMNLLPLMVRSGESTQSGSLSPIGIGSRLKDATAAREWLDKLVDTYAAAKGVAVPRRSQMGTASSGATVSSEALSTLEARYFGKDGVFAGVARQMLKDFGVDLFEKVSADDRELLEDARLLGLYRRELGPAFERVIASRFDADKLVTFNSWWNWARRDLVQTIWQIRRGKLSEAELKNRIELFKRCLDDRLADTILFYVDKAAELDDEKTLRAMQRIEGEVLGSGNARKKTGGAFKDKTVLVTGAGPGSIASEIVSAILKGGGRVVATTSSYSSERLRFFRKLYQRSVSNGAELYVLPFSQGSHQDIEKLNDWVVGRFGVPDFVVPFGAVKELAYLTTQNPGDASATMRVLLQGVEWLVAAVARSAAKVGASSTALLPLSPNHGTFGGDGSYGETKIALSALMNKWSSEYETLGRYINFIGCEIGWVRGTGLMEANDKLAAALEKKTGIKTYSQDEMASKIVSLMSGKEMALAKKGPVTVDLTGGFGEIDDIGAVIAKIRSDEDKCETVDKPSPTIEIKSNPKRFTFPALPTEKYRIQLSERMEGLDPSKVIVIVGFGEVSPFGSAASRFELESEGALSMSSAMDLAWFMGLIRYESGDSYCGWVDAVTDEPVEETKITQIYGETILQNVGIRFIDPATAGFDLKNILVYSDVLLDDDFIFPVASLEEGEAFLRRSPDTAELIRKPGDEGYLVRLKKGMTIKVPKGFRHNRYVAGQIPKGFDAARLGVPKSLVDQVDRTSVFNFIASAEAFMTAGLTPEELNRAISPTRIGNTQGSGLGGMVEFDRLYHDYREERPRKGDTLQETLINTMPAWLTQSYLGAYGPTIHPVGACATAVVSLSVGVDQILAGRADFIVAGGYDDINVEGAVGFADMGATADTDDLLKKGLKPNEMSRPNDSRRAGFVEAQGGGTILLTTLEKAAELGLPIYAVLAYTATHSDGLNPSIPAPGLGLVAMAAGGELSPLSRALRMFGMTADDIAVVSKHDTSTKANDPNENELHTFIQRELGRSAGNPLMVHSQKSVLGHAKGGAGAWQANAAVQMLNAGVVPANPNLENVDEAMRRFDPICFTDEPIDMGERAIQAVIISSLGFGHVGAAALFVHPDRALACLTDTEYAAYKARRALRETVRIRREWMVRMGKEPHFKLRERKKYASNADEAEDILKMGSGQ